jgi:hypothetical protein
MSLAAELLMALTEWKKTPKGYEMKTSKGLAKLYKKGREWVLSIEGDEVRLGRRASFDHAEGALKQRGAKPIGEARMKDIRRHKKRASSGAQLTRRFKEAQQAVGALSASLAVGRPDLAREVDGIEGMLRSVAKEAGAL